VESRAAHRPAVGSLSMKTGETRGYVLTFRCINCGKHEVFGNYLIEHIIPEDRIRGRIYQVRCNSCGWSGDACGLSAICVSQLTDRKAWASGHSTQISDKPIISALKRLIRRSDQHSSGQLVSQRRDEPMSKKRDILDEFFALMQQQMQARPDSISTVYAEECKKRAKRLDELITRLTGRTPQRI